MNTIEYEVVHNSQCNSFNVEEMTCRYFPRLMHCHPEHELVLITSGYGLCFAGDGVIEMKPQHIYFIGSGLPHFFRSDNHYYQSDCKDLCHSCYVQFKDQILPGDYRNMLGCININRLMEAGENGIEWDISQNTRLLASFRELTACQGFERLHLLYKILDELGRMVDEGNRISLLSKTELRSDDESTYCRIVEYIGMKFQEPITLEEIAGHAGMNPSAVCRYFKRKTGESIFGFLLRMRISYAKRKLTETDMAISAIAYDSGFNNLANFNVQFKKFTGYTPSQYRNLYVYPI